MKWSLKNIQNWKYFKNSENFCYRLKLKPYNNIKYNSQNVFQFCYFQVMFDLHFFLWFTFCFCLLILSRYVHYSKSRNLLDWICTWQQKVFLEKPSIKSQVENCSNVQWLFFVYLILWLCALCLDRLSICQFFFCHFFH